MPITRRRLALATGALLAAPAVSRAQGLPRVKYQIDWAFQGPNAFMLFGRDRGYFRDAGIDIQLDRGFGSGRVPIDVAGGAYEIAQADMSPVIKFIAENPNAGIVVVGVFGDRSLLCATVRSDGPVREPKALEGKTLAAPDTDAGRQIFPAFARAAGVDASKINWLTVRPELREPMLVQGRAHGITGAATSTGLSLKALGMDWPQQRILWYCDYGLPLYGTCWLTTRDYARRNPELVRAAVRGGMRSLREAYRDQAAVIAALKTAEPLTDTAIEAERQLVSFREQIVSDHVMANGLSAVVPSRLQTAIGAVEEAYGMTPRLRPEDVYTDGFLPPAEERRLVVRS